MEATQWPTEWLRGVLEICVLRIISRGPTYGYAIAGELTSAGLGTLKGGTLYPLLARCEQAGLVEVEWKAGESGPGRKYYRLTALGQNELEQQAAQWLAFTQVAAAAVSGDATSTQTQAQTQARTQTQEEK